jgi:MFS transporter, DHA1 family, tetracycline resistance protein
MFSLDMSMHFALLGGGPQTWLNFNQLSKAGLLIRKLGWANLLRNGRVRPQERSSAHQIICGDKRRRPCDIGGMRTTHSSSLLVVAFVVFIDMLGIGLIIPVMPNLIREISSTNIEHAAEIGGFLLFIYASMQFICAPLIGGLSDRFGRRPVLLTTLFLLGIDYAVMAFASSLTWLIVGRLISGIMGATWSAANSCVADCIPVERRGNAFGILGGAGAAGFVLGPAVGGVAGEIGTRAPFLFASCLAIAGAVAGLLFLKETLPPNKRRRFDLLRANPLGSIIQMTKTPFVRSCLTVVFFMQLAGQAQLSIWAYWGELEFAWTPWVSGLTVSFYGILLGVAQAALTGSCVARFGASNTAKWTLLFGLPSYLLLAFAPTTSIAIAAIIVGAITGITFPTLQGPSALLGHRYTVEILARLGSA